MPRIVTDAPTIPVAAAKIVETNKTAIYKAPRTRESASCTASNNRSIKPACSLCLHHTRKLSKNLSFQFRSNQYQIQGYGNGYRLRGACLRVCEAFDGSVTLLHQGKQLSYRLLKEGETPIPVLDEKSIQCHVDQAKLSQQHRPTYKPAIDHPWR